MADNYCLMTIAKINSMLHLNNSYKHNFREIPLKHVDTTLSENNEELLDDTGLTYREMWYKRMKDVEIETGQPVTKRKNSVIAYEIVVTFSRGAKVDMEAWKTANVEWVKKTFGEDNVLSAQLHEDETTPHIHFIVTPIDERGKLCAKSFTGGRTKMFGLQKSYGEAMAPLGLKRGELYSRSKKDNLHKFYKAVDKATTAEAPKMEANESIDSYVKRVNAYIQDIQIESLWKEKKLTRERDLERTKFAQFRAKYNEAIYLQDDLEESFNGNMRMVKERLQTYQDVEKAVPRKTLNSFLNNILQKFPLEENLRSLRRRKKKKKNSEVDIDTM